MFCKFAQIFVSCLIDCGLDVHTASNQHNERNFEYYWGYKNHILVDCITGLPIYEQTITANISDSTVALDILENTNEFISVKECTFIADKGYDVKAIYNTVKDIYSGDCVIPLNKRNSKKTKFVNEHPICEAGLMMHKDGKFSDNGRTRQKYSCPYKLSKTQECPCNHKNRNNGKKYRCCTKYITLPTKFCIFGARLEFLCLFSLLYSFSRFSYIFLDFGVLVLLTTNCDKQQSGFVSALQDKKRSSKTHH